MKKYYPNLNTLRFIAASLVIIHHIEQMKSLFGIANFWHVPFFEVIGKLGVVLFFVLSGFLITTLLLDEKDHKGKIDVGHFYLRRVLRIWPVYYLIVVLGFFVWPYLPFLEIPGKDIFPEVLGHRMPNILFYLTIFANLGVVIYGSVPYTSQSWSIATEEQFYLFWPFVVICFSKRLVGVMSGILVGYWVIRYFFHYKNVWLISDETQGIVRGFLYYFNINCMALGGYLQCWSITNRSSWNGCSKNMSLL